MRAILNEVSNKDGCESYFKRVLFLQLSALTEY